jgi:hypothetical protein
MMATQFAELNSKLENSNQENSQLKTEKESLNSQISNIQSTLTVVENQYTTIEDKAICKGSSDYKFDLTNNTTVSDSLKVYVGDKDGQVIKTEWEVIWSNTKSSIHRLYTSEHMDVFVVDFQDDALKILPSIYNANDECFMDIGK